MNQANLQIYVCPSCKGALRRKENALACSACSQLVFKQFLYRISQNYRTGDHFSCHFAAEGGYNVLRYQEFSSSTLEPSLASNLYWV